MVRSEKKINILSIETLYYAKTYIITLGDKPHNQKTHVVKRGMIVLNEKVARYTSAPTSVDASG